MASFPNFKQADSMDCGPACLKIIGKYYGRHFSIVNLRELSETTRLGSNMYSLSEAAEKLGFRTLGAKITFDQLRNEAPLPCIIHWQQNHFLVIYKITKSKVYVSDPSHGLLSYSKQDFIKRWCGGSSENASKGMVLLLEPTDSLLKTDGLESHQYHGFGKLWEYINRYKKFLTQIIFGLIAVSLIQLVFPFLTQSIVDVGINNRDVHFIYLLLIAQLFLFLGRTSVELVRGWILLHLSARINISLVSDFFIKLMRLPISYFDTKMTGDIMQRINDHSRIEKLLTSASLSALFSLINLIIFGLVLAWYSTLIFAIFFIGTLMYLGWVLFFLKKRGELDYKYFSEVSNNQSKIIELINGMQEIKLHNAERQKRWGWERIQVRLFKISTNTLALEQFQTVGASFINETKNIGITMLAATLVIDGNITLGMMLSISYILGQLNGPVQQILSFVHSLQDAKISIERIGEIHSKPDEEPNQDIKINEIPIHEPIVINNLSFRYKGSTSFILQELNLVIPPFKTTAIVGASGSGKTTLMKLLLKFYEPSNGEIKLGNYMLSNISQHSWRKHCGVVMQEGHIFNDTIANNIAIGDDSVDINKLLKAIEIANIKEFIESLPLAYNTKIGNEGVGISTGQKQRILIARAVYKNPTLILFDEATSSLDASNESIVVENLKTFFKGRTSIIIAHRLSTVQHADQIIVLGEGNVIETGTHQSLISKRGTYYNLIKNQLQLETITNGK
jgi:ATP-binding cassette, subfamily B, bacterial